MPSSTDTHEAAARALLAELPPATVPASTFLGARFDRGLAFLDDPDHQAELEQLLRDAGAPDPFVRNPIALGMVAPTLRVHGTPDQQERLLRPLFTGEEVWCQLFSEPGAGSDLASLACRAERTDEGWVVSGQKVWTSLAHVARRGLLLARTDSDAPKHKGLTCFALDMRSAGVEVRPLRQITGEAEFNEVFLDEVVVPDRDRLGDPGNGWTVAITTLLNERSAIGGALAAHGGGPIDIAIETYRRHAAAGTRGAVARQRLVDAWIRTEVLRLTNLRAAQLAEAGTPGPEGSVAKLGLALQNQLVTELTVDLLGPEGMLLPPDDEPASDPDDLLAATYRVRDPQRSFLRARANTIEGGTTEVMRNILGERVLGLPREPSR
jgi:alkylation response protein AidB-like acyl-CoA dehydrogenase